MAERDSETIAEILAAYRAGGATPAEIVSRSYARIRALDDPAIFISLIEEKEALAQAKEISNTEMGKGTAGLSLPGMG